MRRARTTAELMTGSDEREDLGAWIGRRLRGPRHGPGR
jgi:hypothetical protein